MNLAHHRQRIAIFILALFFGILLLVPLALAQDSTPDPNDNLIMVTGAIDFSQGDIRVGEYIIAPAGANTPSSFMQGDIVIVIGTLLPDGMTIQADTFELFDDPEATPEATPETTPEATPESTPEATPESTPEATPEATPESTPEATPEATDEPEATDTPDDDGCGGSHPVGDQLAEGFGVSSDEIMDLHCNGWGFGEIARAYLLAQQTGMDVQTFIDQREGGMGWGQIRKDAGVDPSDLAPGQVIRHGGKHDDEATPEAESEDLGIIQPQNNGNGNGGGNGQGNDNGNNGQGNDNGNNGQGNDHNDNGNGNDNGDDQVIDDGGNGNGNDHGNGNNDHDNDNGNGNNDDHGGGNSNGGGHGNGGGNGGGKGGGKK